MSSDDDARIAIDRAAVPLGRDSIEPLLRRVGDARFVLLGEATHGTHEFYRVRSLVTRRLFDEHGFSAVAVEADWPDAYRVNRFVRGAGSDTRAAGALADFERFPRWVWKNADVLEFVTWLRERNLARPAGERAGFYGLDLYSLRSSIAWVVDYLERIDPDAARHARERYACFEMFGDEPHAYGYAAALRIGRDCEEEVVRQLSELRARRWQHLAHDGWALEDEVFSAERNAAVAKNAERYYREVYRGDVSSWNVRDRHMFETLEALAEHLTRDRPAKIVVWAHNSHLGDARFTAQGRRGELNLGQLARECWGDEALLVGFTTYEGTVAAANDWDGPVRKKTVLPARRASWEALFHASAFGRFFLDLSEAHLEDALAGTRLERAIGVVYRPQTELASHYFGAQITRQFDAVLHYDRTRALEPLDREPSWDRGELPETYPTGF
jgi:erythromycin esterase-like protein